MLAHELERPQRPLVVEVVPQFEFVGELADTVGCGVTSGGGHGHESVTIIIGGAAADPAKHALAVCPQDLGLVFPISARPGRSFHLPAPLVLVRYGRSQLLLERFHERETNEEEKNVDEPKQWRPEKRRENPPVSDCRSVGRYDPQAGAPGWL